MNGPDRSLATLFADVAGSTGLYQRHGDQVALAAVIECIEVMKAAALEFGGRVVKTIGDELMAVFQNANDAFTAACEMQWRVSELPPVGSDVLAVRIGFHLGPALEHDGERVRRLGQRGGAAGRAGPGAAGRHQRPGGGIGDRA